MTATSIATARPRRNTRVDSSTAMTTTRIHSSCGSTASTIRAKMSVGIDIMRSFSRDSPWSAQPPATAAVKERMMPMEKASRSEEHTSELQSLMRISYAVFCLKKKNNNRQQNNKQKKNKYTQE